ncbi:MAG: hypothetical protein A2Z59_07760 [Nitrospinae bacterium RIFCSPLOWO2_02_39_17]|nr:MAG: hypothetical protein A2Z59_07760 [Nitrospinae bacterium RIFCSPLOWO2_02_39_17]
MVQHMKKNRGKNTNKTMNEAEWNKDLIKKLRKDLEEIENINITKGKVLRDIFIVHEDKNYKLQLGVF